MPDAQATGTSVQGEIAHDSPISGTYNPLLLGAYASAAAPTAVSTDGDAVRLWAKPSGALAMFITDTDNTIADVIGSQGADTGNNSWGALVSAGHNYGYSGSQWERLRVTGQVEGTGDLVPLTGVLATGIGPGFDRRDNPTNLATAANSTSTFDVNGTQMLRIGINTSTTGTFTIEATADNVTWVAPEAYDAGADARVTGASLTPTVGKVYAVVSGGYRQMRLRTVTTLGATMAHFFTGSLADAGIEKKTIPYLGQVSLLQAAARYTSAQTSTNLVAGTAGQRIYVSQMSIATGGTTAVRVSVYYGTGAFSSGTSPTIFDGEFAPSATVRPGAVLNFPIPSGGSSATGDNLRVTTDAAGTVYVNGHYYKA